MDGEMKEGGKIVGIEGRALAGAHGRQLGSVADEHEPAVVAFAHIVHQVVEQAAVFDAALVVLTYHGGFVDNEKGVGMFVQRPRHAHGAGAVGDGLVDFAVDGEGGLSRIGSQHFGSTACGGKKYGFDA